MKDVIAPEGINVPVVSLPYPNPHKPDVYGRHSHLRAIPELKDAPLLAVPVASADQAMRLLSVLVR